MAPFTGSAVSSFINPIINYDFPDPHLLVTDDGYYLYATQYFGTHNIQVAYSIDLINWEPIQTGALRSLPQYASQSREVWAPCVERVNDEYRLYYSINTGGQNDRQWRFGIGLAKSNRPLDFVDTGPALRTGPGYQVIDFHYFKDPISEREFGYYGSHHTPIFAQELEEYGYFRRDTQPQPIISVEDRDYLRLLEGPFVYFDEEYQDYVALVSGDNTWQRYAIIAYRAPTPTGPFRRQERLALKGNQRWTHPGQGCCFQDASGDYWFAYHACDPRDPYVPGTRHPRRVAMLDRINRLPDGTILIGDGTPTVGRQACPSLFRQVMAA